MVEAEVTEERARKVPVREIVDEMCKMRRISHEDFLSARRTRWEARSRQMTMWLADRLRPELSFKVVAKLIGREDHSTIICGVDKIDALIAAGDRDTISSLVQMYRRLGVCPTMISEMTVPRRSRLTPTAKAKREERKDKWTMQPSMPG